MKGEVEMIQIRPVSDLRNKFPEIETLVNSGYPVYLTKNGYGANSLGGGFCICDKCYEIGRAHV